MATIKSYTTIEQSRKLAEFLPLESADMCYLREDGKAKTMSPSEISEILNVSKPQVIPCWSLAALLGVLPDYTLQTNTDGTVFVVCDSKKPMISDSFSNPVDACVAMIEKLHELNLL